MLDCTQKVFEIKIMRPQVWSNTTGIHLEGLIVIAIQLLHMHLAAEKDFEEKLLHLDWPQASPLAVPFGKGQVTDDNQTL